MKKLVIAACLVAGFGFSSTAQEIKAEPTKTKEETKAVVMDQCKASIPKEMDATVAETVCSCVSDKVMTQMSTDEVALLTSTNPQLNEDLKGKMMELVKGCLAENPTPEVK